MSTEAHAHSGPPAPMVADRAAFQAELDKLRVREKAHTREGDAIAAARRRLPMVEVDASLDADRARTARSPCSTRSKAAGSSSPTTSCGAPAAPRPSSARAARGVTSQVGELSYLHSRDITYAVFCQGPYDESVRYRDFMGWDMPWYSAQASLDTLLVGRRDRPVPPRVLPAGRRPRLRDLLDDPPRRRGDGLQLRAHGPHRVRAPGAVGGLAARLAAAVLQHPD